MTAEKAIAKRKTEAFFINALLNALLAKIISKIKNEFNTSNKFPKIRGEGAGQTGDYRPSGPKN
jgi:hypothetical protein